MLTSGRRDPSGRRSSRRYRSENETWRLGDFMLCCVCSMRRAGQRPRSSVVSALSSESANLSRICGSGNRTHGIEGLLRQWRADRACPRFLHKRHAQRLPVLQIERAFMVTCAVSGMRLGGRVSTKRSGAGFGSYKRPAGAIAERGSLLPRGFSVRSTGRLRYTGALPIPDPRAWPAEICSWYKGITGKCGPRDVFIFQRKAVGEMYLADAVTALGILDVRPDEWHTEDGYPVFIFERSRIADFQLRLAGCGYSPRILVEVARTAADQTKKRGRADIVDISRAGGGKGVKDGLKSTGRRIDQASK